MHTKKKKGSGSAKIFREFEKDIDRQIKMNRYFIEELPEIEEEGVKLFGEPVEEAFGVGELDEDRKRLKKELKRYGAQGRRR